MVSKGFRFGLINQWYRRRKLWTHLLASRGCISFSWFNFNNILYWMNEPYQKYFKFYPWILCPKYHFFGASFFGNWQILTVDQPSLQDFSLRSEGTFFVIVRTANLLKDFWKRHNFSGTRYRGSRRSSASQGQEILIKFYWVCVNISDFFPITSLVPSFS